MSETSRFCGRFLLFLTRRTRRNIFKLVCHREGRSPAAISWYNVLDLTQYQEIASLCVHWLAMTEDDGS